MMFFVSHNVPENKPLPGGVGDTKKVLVGTLLPLLHTAQRPQLPRLPPPSCLLSPVEGRGGVSHSVSSDTQPRLLLADMIVAAVRLPTPPKLTHSHHTPSTTLPHYQVLLTSLVDRDWCEQQVLASANWGGHIANFFTGGLNLQVRAW